MTKTRINLDPVRGFRDILPPDSEELTRLAQIFTQVARSHGYREVKPPTLERFELFALKSGEEIKKTMYVFKDKSGRELALRPEATASVARIYLKHLRAKPKPIRLYYIVNCFRYENPQHARYREFWQAGVELLGDDSLASDFEVLKLLLAYYESIGMLKHIKVKIGTTETYRILFAKNGIPEETQDLILHYMDKKEYGKALEIVAEKAKNTELQDVLKTLWSNPHSLREAIETLKAVDEDAAKSIQRLEKLVEMTRTYNPSVSIEPDVSFARGLAYYTGIIFEVQVPGFPVSIAGGGRYDNLIELYGGEHVPSTGFAIGLDRTLIAAKEMNIELRLGDTSPRTAAAIIALREEYLPYAAHVQDTLVRIGVPATLYVERKLHKIIPRLLEEKYTHLVVIGEREVANRMVTVKNLETREQQEIPLDKLSNLLSTPTP